MQVTLTVTGGPNRGATYSFDRHDTFIVGRGWSAHLRLPPRDRYFSRNHFLLEINPPLCRLLDMASSNGTYVNDQRVSQADLQDGDRIRGGDTVIRVGITTESPPASATTPPPVTEPREPSAATPPDGELLTKTLDCQSREEVTEAAEDAVLGEFGRFQLLKELGRGGMGVVYLARASNGERVALKTLNATGPVSPRDLQRFLREASILKQLRHPNTVTFHECGEWDGTVYLSMEYVPGPDARRLLREAGKLPVAQAIGIVCEVLSALDFAHSRQFVHRDIKPANILVGQANGKRRVKLSDFGLARVYQASRFSGLTMQGELAGSMAFMPPEQITNYRNAEPASDLYATSATLYTLLTGHCIYDFPRRMPQRLLMILQEDPIPISRRRADLPAGLAEIIHQGLQRDPANRFPSAATMRNLLLPYG